MTAAADEQDLGSPIQYLEIVIMHDALVYVEDEKTPDTLNEREETVSERLDAHLKDQSKLSQYIPSPPKQLMQLINELEQEETDFDKIQEIIKKDLALLGEIVRISNSPLYRPRSGEITSIEKAISMLGINGVMEIASQLLLRRAVQVDSPHYKKFSQFHWAHCLKSAEAGRFIGEREDSFANYLLGLIHSIGRVVILTCYVHLSGGKSIEGVNNLNVIKHASLEQSSWLSTQVAKEWDLPEVYPATLGEFERLTMNLLCGNSFELTLPSTNVLQLGSIAAQVHTLIEHQQLELNAGLLALSEIGLDNKRSEALFGKFDLLGTA